VKASRVKPLSKAKVQARGGDVAKVVQGCSRTEVLSLMSLALAVVLLAQLGVITWAVDTYARAPSGYSLDESGQGAHYRTLVQPGYVLPGLFFTAVALLGKEFLMQRKAITLTVNATAIILGVCYAALYIVYRFHSAILYDFTLNTLNIMLTHGAL